MLGVLLGGMYYIYHVKHRPAAPVEEPLPPPPALDKEPPPILTDTDIGKVRLATQDADPQVRWAAIEFLHRVRDPMAFEMLEKTLAIDTEQVVRRKALDILKGSGKPDVTKDIVKALDDSEKDIRLAALVALGEIGDPKTAPYIVKALTDSEPDVRMQALHTLGLIQAKTDASHKQMQDELRAQYEELVRKKTEEIQRMKTASFFNKRLKEEPR